MTTPDTQPPPEPESKQPKPRRKRRTKAEMEAARAAKIAEANKPIDSRVGILLGIVLLLVGACIYFDPLSFATGVQPNDQNWTYLILTTLINILGKNPTALILTVLAVVSIGWGMWGWLRKRSDNK